MKNYFSGLIKKKTVRLAAVAAVAALLAPNGFFTGHRTVILEGEITLGKPETHMVGLSRPERVTLYGTVTSSSGLVISGAMITAFDSGNNRRITAYSGPDGRYRLAVPFAGELSIRVRTPYFEDAYKTVALSDAGSAEVNFQTEEMTDPDDLSESLPASAHVATVHWPRPEDKAAFISQCNYCHQIGNALTRRPRDRAEWDEVVSRMEGYLALITDDEKESIIDRLHETFQGDPIKAVETWDVSPLLSRAVVEEWNAGDGYSFIHDTDVGRDGRLYGVDEGHDTIWVLDRATGAIDQVDLPDVDLPEGGKFSGYALPIGVFTGKHGPHSLVEGNDGRLWITNALSSRLMAYTPETHSFETFDIGADALYPHTIRKDLKGRLWFTLAASNQVGRFDPETRQLDLLDLPSNGLARWLSDAMTPAILYIGSLFPRENLPVTLSHHKMTNLGREILSLPYGIDVNPLDGSIWYAKLNGNKIGRIDPETFELKEFDVPGGPRRPRFAPNGILWIPGFDASALLSFNPETEEIISYPLPVLAPGEYETPYALNVHPETGVVWITSNMSDRIFSFHPGAKIFTSYPLPTRVSYLRDLVFTDDGKICSSNSNLPSYAIEGGLGGFICLDPGE